MTTLGVNVTTQDPTYSWADIYSRRMKPPKISQAEGKARELYQLYDRLVDEATDKAMECFSNLHDNGFGERIEEAWQEYKQADEYAAMLRRQYHADPNPARWF